MRCASGGLGPPRKTRENCSRAGPGASLSATSRSSTSNAGSASVATRPTSSCQDRSSTGPGAIGNVRDLVERRARDVQLPGEGEVGSSAARCGGGVRGSWARVSTACDSIDPNRPNPPSPLWDFPKYFPTVKIIPGNALFSTSSTSWGSLVRAQCRPPHESPAAVGFLVSERIGVRVRGGVAAEWLRTTLRSPGQRSTRVTRADNRTPGYWVTAWPDRVRRAKLLA